MPKISWQPRLQGLARWTVRLGIVGLLAGLMLAAPAASTSNKSDKAGKVGKADKTDKSDKSKEAKQEKIAKQAEEAKAKQQQAEEEALAEPFAAEHPQITLSGLRCQVHKDGKVQQELKAFKGEFDELANILDLSRLNVQYLDQGTTVVGQLNCGRGRIWTKSHPEKGINAHDMLLQQGVQLQTRDQMVLQSPEMRYNAAASTIASTRGYTQQMPAGKQFMIGRGQRFELKLNLEKTSTTEKNSFEYWKAFGNPAEMRKSEKPVLNP